MQLDKLNFTWLNENDSRKKIESFYDPRSLNISEKIHSPYQIITHGRKSESEKYKKISPPHKSV